MSGTVEVPVIKTPPAVWDPIRRLSDFLTVTEQWHQDHVKTDGGMLSDLWYRGVNRHFDSQAPGVYRSSFTERARRIVARDSIEGKRLRLERDTISQFRSAGAAFLQGFSNAQIYFVAQHFGMPTRLLDWSTNPLAALFFACDGENDEDGFVYAMDAKHVIPENTEIRPGKRLYRGVMTMRHTLVKYAIGMSLWEPIDKTVTPFVIPVRPDVIPGRIGQQSSVFTLHMHKANLVENPTLVTLMIDKASKSAILKELHRVNVNQFTTYYDLDHLSREIRKNWGC